MTTNVYTNPWGRTVPLPAEPVRQSPAAESYTSPWGRRVVLPAAPARETRVAASAPPAARPALLRAKVGSGAAGTGWAWVPASTFAEQHRPAATRPATTRPAIVQENR